MTQPTRRLISALLSVFLSVFLVTAVAATPAFALDSVPATSSDAATTIHAKGTIIVLSGREVLRGADAVSMLPDQVNLRTQSGQWLLLAGETAEAAISGSSFDGTLAIPTAMVNAINLAVGPSLQEARSGTDPVDGASEVGLEVLDASQDLGAALTIVAATITPPVVEALQASKAHIVDVAVMVPPGDSSPSPLSDSGVNTLVSTLGAYWASQSGGQVASISKPRGVYRTVSAAACDAQSAWEEAAAAFGDPSGDSYYWGGQPRHLIVIASASCTDGAGSGLGSLGDLNAGGLAWGTYDAVVGPSTIAHELGHNLGLHHSNAHVCSGNRIEGTAADGCQDLEYVDYYDIMGGGLTVNGLSNTQLLALNVTHKFAIGALSSADLRTVQSNVAVGTTTVNLTLNPISTASGLRGLRVVDPSTGGVYFVEYRSGTGIDSGSIYASRIYEDMQPGVRILRLRDDLSSAVLTIPDAVQPDLRHFSLHSGQSLALPSGTLTFAVKSLASSAAVTITLGSGAAAPVVDRISGADRYSTAVAISKKGFPGTAPVVYVATGANYPDALGAAPAATKQGGPLLLTPAGSLPAVVQSEIQRLKPGKIVVVGGTAAVSATTFAQLKVLAPNVIRLAGADRFETARKIIANAFTTPVASTYIATGLNYPDALSASAAAGASGIPVVLVNGGAASVDAPTKALLNTLKPTKLSVVGGTAAVSTGIATSLASVGTVSRIAGTDRFDTSERVNKAAFANVDHAYFATGFQFPDALAGAALAGAKQAPLYVVQTDCVPMNIRADLVAYKTTAITLIGGTSALGAGVSALKPC